MAQAVGARLRGLTEEDSVLLEAMVPTARLPVPPPRKAPALGRPPPWEGGKSPPGSHGSLQLCWPRVCPLGGGGWGPSGCPNYWGHGGGREGHPGCPQSPGLGLGDNLPPYTPTDPWGEVGKVTLDPHGPLWWGGKSPWTPTVPRGRAGCWGDPLWLLTVPWGWGGQWPCCTPHFLGLGLAGATTVPRGVPKAPRGGGGRAGPPRPRVAAVPALSLAPQAAQPRGCPWPCASAPSSAGPGGTGPSSARYSMSPHPGGSLCVHVPMSWCP